MSNEQTGIWITGASSGIGKAAVEEFASVGCKIFATARRVTELDRLKKEINSKHLEIYPCNVASQANVEQIFKKITSENQINCLVNNAGITSFKTAEDNTIKEIDDIIKTNLLGSIYTLKSTLAHMKKMGGGMMLQQPISRPSLWLMHRLLPLSSRMIFYPNMMPLSTRRHQSRIKHRFRQLDPRLMPASR